MNQNEVRRGVTQARNNTQGAGLYGIEVIIISIVLGFLTHSWIVFGLLLIGLMIGINFKNFAIAIGILLTLMWIFIGWKIGSGLDSVAASVVISVIFGLISIAVHAGAHDFSKDSSN